MSVAPTTQAAGSGGRVSAALTAKAVAAVDADAKRLETIFKDIHQHPELGFMETRTAEIVAKELRAVSSQYSSQLISLDFSEPH